MKRFVASSLAVFLLLQGVPLSEARGIPARNIVAIAESRARATVSDGLVTRAELLREAVAAFYGEVTTTYPTSFRNVPGELRKAVSLASALGALQGWGTMTNWEETVSRGQALRVLFALAQTEASDLPESQFRDVAIEDAGLAQQTVQRDLLAPLTPKMFGWNRTLRGEELSQILARFERQVTIPLTAPPPKALAPDAARTRQPRAPATPRKSNLQKKGITVEFFVDPGSRITKQDLPLQDILSTVWGIVQARYLYLDKVDEKEIGYAIAEKIMSSLGDQYSSFLRPTNSRAFQQQLEGELTGVGAQVEIHSEGGVLVVSPLPGSPAYKAGVKPGDRITHVDGESIVGMTLQDAVAKIRGPVGSTVKLTIVRNGSSIVIDVIRAKISIPEIEASIQDRVAVIKLYQFGEHTIADLGSVFQKLLAQQPIGMVLDLRNNPGGLLDAAIAVLEHFFPKGTVVAHIKSRSSTRTEVTRKEMPTVPASLPLIVIVNKGSASASEIVAGALQDLGRGTILGAQTFGKGTVQEVSQLGTGGEAVSVKLTTGEWLTPDKRSIEENGITPDVRMEEAEAGSRDELLLRAIQLIKTSLMQR